jgi:rod shape-determining protein MreC
MTLRRRVLDYSLAGLLLLIPLILLHASFKKPENLNRFDEAVLRVSSPLQAVVSWAVEGIGGVVHRYVWLVDVDKENEELRAENERLRRLLAEAHRRALDNDVLEELVGLRARTTADTIGARIISASINPYFRVVRVRLDRGEEALSPGMPVITSAGLVGRVQHVYGRYSDVLLATDPQSAIDVRIPRTGGRGVLTGLGRDDSYRCEIGYLERGKEVQIGDLVVTSGLGSAFPPGIVVGHVARIDTKEYGLFQEVEVEPIVDFSDLGYVLVLLAPPPPPDPGAGRRRVSSSAHGVRPY